MASKRQRRQRGATKKTKPRRKVPPPPSILLGRQGLVADPNADLAPRKRQQLVHKEQVWVPAAPKEPKPKRTSEFDRRYMGPLLSKYGTDFAKMAVDRKLNADQLTERQLQKRYSLMQAADVVEDSAV